jgi:flagellar basal body-associated protein FliL
MAWEEENIDGSVDIQEVRGGKKGKLKWILILVVVLVVLGIGGFFAWRMMGSDEPEVTEEAAQEEAASPESNTSAKSSKTTAAKEKGPAPEIGHKVDLQTFTVNLADQDEVRYMRVSIVLEVSAVELRDFILDETDPKLYMVKTRDAVAEILRGKTAAEMNDQGNIRELRKEIMFRLNHLYHDGEVMEVYLTDLVVQ